MKTTREIARAFLVTDRFATRHIGPSPDETQAMLATLGYSSLDAFIDAVVPADIRLSRPLNLPPGRSEREVLQALRGFAAQNQLYRRSEEHTSELQSQSNLVCRLLLEKKKKTPVSNGVRRLP